MRLALDRRGFLKAAGLGVGAAMFAPFLRSVARAQSGNAPRRFVFVVEGNCFEPVTMLSSAARTALEAAAGASVEGQRWFYRTYPSLQSPVVVADTDFATAPALASVVGDGVEPSLASQTAVLLGLSSKITGGGHSTHHGALSCTRSSGGKPGGETIDAHLAALPQVRRDTPFDAVRVGISAASGRPLNYDTCAYARGRAAAILLQPDAAFHALFGSVASAAGMAAFQQRSQLLDFAAADVSAMLQTFPGSSAERAKLEGYLEAVERVSARQARLLEMEAEGQRLSMNKPPDPEVNPLYTSGDPLDKLRAQFELAAAALKGELTNVVVIASGTGTSHFSLSYPSLTSVARHDLHHGSAGNPAFLEVIHSVTALQVEMITALARELLATPEPGAGGSMLDHTAIVYISDNGEQHHSTASEWPVLLVGGSALGLRTEGRTVIYPGLGQPGHRQVSNLFNTLGFCAGEELTHFGQEGPSRVAPGPLGEIYG